MVSDAESTAVHALLSMLCVQKLGQKQADIIGRYTRNALQQTINTSLHLAYELAYYLSAISLCTRNGKMEVIHGLIHVN